MASSLGCWDYLGGNGLVVNIFLIIEVKGINRFPCSAFVIVISCICVCLDVCVCLSFSLYLQKDDSAFKQQGTP